MYEKVEVERKRADLGPPSFVTISHTPNELNWYNVYSQTLISTVGV